jgi:hypothetical protein
MSRGLDFENRSSKLMLGMMVLFAERMDAYRMIADLDLSTMTSPTTQRRAGVSAQRSQDADDLQLADNLAPTVYDLGKHNRSALVLRFLLECYTDSSFTDSIR